MTPAPASTLPLSDESSIAREMSSIKLSSCKNVADMGFQLGDLWSKHLNSFPKSEALPSQAEPITHFLRNLGPRYQAFGEALLRDYHIIPQSENDPLLLRYNDVFVRAMMQEEAFLKEDLAREIEHVSPESFEQLMKLSSHELRERCEKHKAEVEERKRRLHEEKISLMQENARLKRELEEVVMLKQKQREELSARLSGVSPPRQQKQAAPRIVTQPVSAQSSTTTTSAVSAKTKTNSSAASKQEHRQPQSQPRLASQPQNSHTSQPHTKQIPPTSILADPSDLLKSVEAAANAAENAARRHAEMLKAFMATPLMTAPTRNRR